MASKRNISIEVPKLLLDQIQKRAILNSRTRNGEVRYLLRMGLDEAGEDEIQIKLPVDNKQKATARIDLQMEAELLSRCRAHERSLGSEIVRMLAYAIQVRTDREIAAIAEMMSHRGQAAAGTPPLGSPAPQPS